VQVYLPSNALIYVALALFLIIFVVRVVRWILDILP
jgi:hypothetical protein